MAAGTKVAAFGALIRVLYVSFGPLRWDWRPIVWGVAILTMAVGAIVAITQRDVKRMLAYSAIAHAGFILVGVAATSTAGLSELDVLPGDVRLHHDRRVRRSSRMVRTGDAEANDLSSWQGLGQALAGAGRHVRLPAAALSPGSR